MICSLVRGVSRLSLQTFSRNARLAVSLHTAKFSASSTIASDFGTEKGDGRVDEELHEQLLTRYNLAAMDTQQVFVIQPFKRRSSNDRLVPVDSDARLNLAESVALVDTLGWKVVDKEVVGLSHYEYPAFFKWGKLQDLSERVRQNAAISAVFLSTYRLQRNQRFELEVGYFRRLILLDMKCHILFCRKALACL